jgi:ribulose-bisphosphate carboxylase large chain
MRKDYIDQTYKPKANEFIAEYYIEPEKGYTVERAANAVAGESSIDTWTDIKTLSQEIAKRLKPHVFHIKGSIVKIAYSAELFEPGSVAQLLSSLAGNILSMKLVKNLRLIDIQFPKAYVASFPGPLHGIAGIRKLMRVKNRPFLGTIVKPKLGLTPAEHAQVAYNAWAGGLDFVKDDENLTDQGFNRFNARVKATLKARARAEQLTKQRKMYMPNVTAPTAEELIARAKFVKSQGGEYVMVDIITSGWTAIQSLRQANSRLGLVLHAHRCMHSAYTRNPHHGISMLTVAKLTRLIGLDQLHTGTIVGKMEGGANEVLDIDHEMLCHEMEPIHLTLAQKWYSIKPLMPVASGGIQPLMIPRLVKYFGNNIILQFGGGVHAHPEGTIAGARAACQALNATLKNIPLKSYASTHKELAGAFQKWG